MATGNFKSKQWIKTIGEKCRVCYTCVRECPAKAIRIKHGQAEIIAERCINCGNCVRVCSQKAKMVYSSVDDVYNILKSNNKVAAIIAPSFPAELESTNYKKNVSMIRKLGFDYVLEVSFGADIVAKKYKELLEKDKKNYISTACPAVVSYIEKYYIPLVDNLAPIASPMVVTGRVVKKKYGEDVKVVFIGPCIAKKAEADKTPDNSIDSVLTFSELIEMLEKNNISINDVEESDFDPPYPSTGVVFPLGGGLSQSAGIEDNLLYNEVASAKGTKDFVDAIKEFSTNDLDTHLLDVLCCDGCIMGPGFNTNITMSKRKTLVSNYARKRYEELDKKEWEKEMVYYKDIDTKAEFKQDNCLIPIPSKFEIIEILKRMGKYRPEDELNCGACGYHTCIEHAIAIYKGLAETEMCLPFTIEKYKENAVKLSKSYMELENTQKALIQAEKLASMGQLAAGIAHEVNNPLGIVLLYAHLVYDNIDKDSDMYEDIKMIVEQTDRCKKIVGGLLNFARKNKIILQKTNINCLVKRCLESIIIPKHVKIEFKSKENELYANVDSDQLMQALMNLITNAVEAINEELGGSIYIKTKIDNENLIITIKDTGIGIKEDSISKIFEPFFTTKQMGKGTGLGLAVTYGIIKMHMGQINVVSNTDPNKGETGTTVTVSVPKNRVN